MKVEGVNFVDEEVKKMKKKNSSINIRLLSFLIEQKLKEKISSLIYMTGLLVSDLL